MHSVSYFLLVWYYTTMFKFVWWMTVAVVIGLNMYILDMVRRIDERMTLLMTKADP